MAGIITEFKIKSALDNDLTFNVGGKLQSSATGANWDHLPIEMKENTNGSLQFVHRFPEWLSNGLVVEQR